ncbi:hypothetical protein BKA93DRAFT_747204 [Sparassis latifolia]
MQSGQSTLTMNNSGRRLHRYAHLAAQGIIGHSIRSKTFHGENSSSQLGIIGATVLFLRVTIITVCDVIIRVQAEIANEATKPLNLAQLARIEAFEMAQELLDADPFYTLKITNLLLIFIAEPPDVEFMKWDFFAATDSTRISEVHDRVVV